MTSLETPARFLTITEAAATLRVSTATVYRLVTSGELPAQRVDAGYLVRADHVARRTCASREPARTASRTSATA